MSCPYCNDCPGRCIYQRCPFDPAFTREPDLLPAEPAKQTRHGLVLLIVWAIGMVFVLVNVASHIRNS